MVTERTLCQIVAVASRFQWPVVELLGSKRLSLTAEVGKRRDHIEYSAGNVATDGLSSPQR
jgi:hypothetical protein